jgi:hypothetical protein
MNEENKGGILRIRKKKDFLGISGSERKEKGNNGLGRINEKEEKQKEEKDSWRRDGEIKKEKDG